MSRINAILNNPFFQKYIELNELKERERRFCRHGRQHLIDVARICYILVLEEQKESDFFFGWERRELQDILYAAGILHDVGRWQQYDTGEDHALVSARLAVDILHDAQFSQQEIGIITNAISSHRSGSVGGGVLGEYLRRADDLSRPCWKCDVLEECRKKDRMETVRGLIY